MEYLCYSGKTDFLFKNIKFPCPIFHKILNDYFEDSEIDAYEKKLLTGISKSEHYPRIWSTFCGGKRFYAIPGRFRVFISGK